MKILCLCERGNSRSVALAWLLKDGMGFDAVSLGLRSNGEEVKRSLYEWADKIILVDKRFEAEIPKEIRNKLFVWDVGEDRFFRGFEPELLNKFKDYMVQQGWLITRGGM